MSQEALNFGRLYLVADATRVLYRKLNDAVDQIGIVPAAGACGTDRSDLRRALDRDGRRVAVEHALAIAACASSDTSRAILESFSDPLGFCVVDDLPKMTDKERADLAEGALRGLGPIGAQALVNAYGGRRR